MPLVRLQERVVRPKARHRAVPANLVLADALALGPLQLAARRGRGASGVRRAPDHVVRASGRDAGVRAQHAEQPVHRHLLHRHLLRRHLLHRRRSHRRPLPLRGGGGQVEGRGEPLVKTEEPHRRRAPPLGGGGAHEARERRRRERGAGRVAEGDDHLPRAVAHASRRGEVVVVVARDRERRRQQTGRSGERAGAAGRSGQVEEASHGVPGEAELHGVVQSRPPGLGEELHAEGVLSLAGDPDDGGVRPVGAGVHDLAVGVHQVQVRVVAPLRTVELEDGEA